MDIAERLAKERRGRLAAERLLEQKQRELFAANEKLALHARSLSDQIVEQRQAVRSALSEAEALKGQNSRFLSDLENAHTAAVMAERRLWDSINTIRDGFAVFDPAQRLVAANRAYLAAFDGLAVAPGLGYDSIVRWAAEQAIVDTGELSVDAWVDAMMARWDSEPIEPIVLKFSNNTWVRMVDRRARDGDMVTLDVAGRRLEADVSPEEFARRRAEWTPPEPRFGRGYSKLFLDETTQAPEGCDFRFLERGPATPEPDIF